MSFEAQKQIRENTMELQEFLKDLNQWESRVKEKDKELKTKHLDHVSDKPPVRGQRQTVAQGGVKKDQLQRSPNEKIQIRETIKETASKKAAQHTYDYFGDKWDKFDVEAALKEIDKDEIPISQSNDKLINPREMQATPSVKLQATSDLPTAFKSSSSRAFSDATKEKDLGNTYFKEKKFVQAIDCYSRSIALQPSSIAYANRAIAYIKIRKFKEAESDCTEAIDLDDHYVKAYSRRSTARKELGNYLGALEDAEFALRLDPENKELKEQYMAAKEVCKKIMDVKSAEKRFPVPIEEIKSEETNFTEQKAIEDVAKKVTSPKVASAVSKGQSQAQQVAEKNLVSVQAAVEQATAARVSMHAMVEAPRTFYEFETSWKSFSSNPVQQAEILKVLNPSSLPSLFKDNLSSKLLVEIIHCLKHLFPDCANHAIDLLENFTKTRRFNLTVMCIISKDKLELRELWERVFLGAQLDAGKLEVLKALQSKYQL